MGFRTRAPSQPRKPGGDVPRWQFLLGLVFTVAARGPATQSPSPAAAAGDCYEFSWQWVMEGEDGAVHGRAADLKGRVQLAPAAGGSLQ